jgi:hypothetical protein
MEDNKKSSNKFCKNCEKIILKEDNKLKFCSSYCVENYKIKQKNEKWLKEQHKEKKKPSQKLLRSHVYFQNPDWAKKTCRG